MDRIAPNPDSSSAAALQSSDVWCALAEHRDSLSEIELRALFEQDPQRGKRFRAAAAGIYFDYSKNLLTDKTLEKLFELACQRDLKAAIGDMFCGADINNTEGRPALHVALRDPELTPRWTQEVRDTRAAMLSFAEAVRGGSATGANGEPFRHVVNIGIGGSDLGPRLVVSAFAQGHEQTPQTYFVSNVDSSALYSVLAHCDPKSTLFLLSSKSFSTLETLSNAALAKNWLLDSGVTANDCNRHFAAMTNNREKAVAWGVSGERIFPMAAWVGGRFSLWSSIGMPIAIALGAEQFEALLAGAREMDQNFRTAPFEKNLPVLHGLLSIWSGNFLGARSKAVLPYIHPLAKLPDYLQQLSMESLGKGVHKDGAGCESATGQVIWGSEGTNGQHSFHQLLLQGTENIDTEFIATRTAHCTPEQHRHLLANCLAQSRALLVGKTQQEAYTELRAQGLEEAEARALAIHKAIPGNRGSNTLILDALDPRCVGALLAFYEHSVYVQSAIWGINAFDQWGVELGKVMSNALYDQLQSGPEPGLDSSTAALIENLG